MYLRTLYQRFTGDASDAGFEVWCDHVRIRDEPRAHSRAVDGISSGRCRIEGECRSFFLDTLGVPAAARARTNVCDAVVHRLPSSHGYRFMEFRNRGRFGIVLAGEDALGRKIVIKLLNLSATVGKTMLSEPWLTTARANLEHEVLMLHAVALAAPGTFPVLIDACTITGGRGARFGVLLMEDAGFDSLHTALTRSTGPGIHSVGAAKLMRQCARRLKGLHAAGVIHGDFHTANVVLSAPDVRFVDTSRTCWLPRHNGVWRASRDYDLAVFVNALDDAAMPELCTPFLQEYLGVNKTSATAAAQQLLCTPSEMQARYRAYSRVLASLAEHL